MSFYEQNNFKRGYRQKIYNLNVSLLFHTIVYNFENFLLCFIVFVIIFIFFFET